MTGEIEFDDWTSFCSADGNSYYVVYWATGTPRQDYATCAKDAEDGMVKAQAKLARFTAWRLTQ